MRNALKQINEKNGLLRCAKYAFSPNQLGYCGPDKNRDLFEYCQTQTTDAGLNNILTDFQTLYPYLSFIAKENQLQNPFSQAVVDAYWLGNNLLDGITLSDFYQHLTDNLQLKKKLSKKLFNLVFANFKKPATPHHNFHVFNIWQRTGNLTTLHTIETMDKCRISWAKVKRILPTGYEINYQPLTVNRLTSQLNLATPAKKIVVKGFVDQAKIGDWISLHWEWPCEILTDLQVWNLKQYTERILRLTDDKILNF